jgi:3-oxoacyl-[acyl-carrier-protein] synthase-3
MNGPPQIGVRLAGTGSALPPRVLSNADLEKMVDTSDEWIQQRTGIRERRIVEPGVQDTATLSRDALAHALEAARLKPADLDLIIVGCCTQELNVPSTACRVGGLLGLNATTAFDVIAGCSAFVYALNVAESLVRAGRSNTVGVVGCDVLSNITDYTERSVSILFGDAAGAAVITRDPDPSRGCIYQKMGADGTAWGTLYCPNLEREVFDWDRANPTRLGCLRMQGREVYKFAVTKFREVIEDALLATGLEVDDVAQFICHQSNARIIESAKEKIGLPDDKVLINIDRYGNTSAGSVPVCLDELMRTGKIDEGDIIIFVAFGAGLTWASSVWRL